MSSTSVPPTFYKVATVFVKRGKVSIVYLGRMQVYRYKNVHPRRQRSPPSCRRSHYLHMCTEREWSRLMSEIETISIVQQKKCVSSFNKKDLKVNGFFQLRYGRQPQTGCYGHQSSYSHTSIFFLDRPHRDKSKQRARVFIRQYPIETN